MELNTEEPGKLCKVEEIISPDPAKNVFSENDELPSYKVKKVAMPKDWDTHSKVGGIIGNSCFVVMKTLLNCDNTSINEGEKFDCTNAIDIAQKHVGKEVGMIINLCSRQTYYDSTPFKESKIIYKKMWESFKHHHNPVPNRGLLASFFNVVNSFKRRNDSAGKIILVHCDLGLDRSALFICCYLMQTSFEDDGITKMMTAVQAVDAFENARGHPLRDRKFCLKSLVKLQDFQLPIKNLKNNSMPKAPPPDRWLDYTKVGDRVSGSRFIAMKVPLKDHYYRDVKPEDEFSCEQAVEIVKSKGEKVGLVINLTFTDKYYNPSCFKSVGIEFKKIMVPGRQIPPKKLVVTFTKVVKEFESKNADNNDVILVHCTHGLNRTGYFVCRYLIEQYGLEANKAINNFNSARGHSIEREFYTDHLCKLDIGKTKTFTPIVEKVVPHQCSSSRMYNNNVPFYDDMPLGSASSFEIPKTNAYTQHRHPHQHHHVNQKNVAPYSAHFNRNPSRHRLQHFAEVPQSPPNYYTEYHQESYINHIYPRPQLQRNGYYSSAEREKTKFSQDSATSPQTFFTQQP